MLFLLFYCVMKDVDACFCLVIKKMQLPLVFKILMFFLAILNLHLTVQTFYLADVNLHLQGKKSKL